MLYLLVLLFLFGKYYGKSQQLFLDIIRIYTWLQVNIYNRIVGYLRKGKNIRIENVSYFSINTNFDSVLFTDISYSGTELDISEFNHYENEMICITFKYCDKIYYKFLTCRDDPIIDLEDINLNIADTLGYDSYKIALCFISSELICSLDNLFRAL